jgi:hypothetical protein
VSYFPHSSLPVGSWPGSPSAWPTSSHPQARRERHPAAVAAGPLGRGGRGPAGRAHLPPRRPQQQLPALAGLTALLEDAEVASLLDWELLRHSQAARALAKHLLGPAQY